MQRSKTSIDSFKIRLPIGACNILEDKLSSHKITLYEDTGEIIEEESFKDRAFAVESLGVTTRYVIGRDPAGGTEDVLYILCNSKLLKGDYFQGVHKNNVEVFYQELINQKVASFSLDHFLKGRCVDIDFKRDFYCTDAVKSSTLQWLKSNAKPTRRLNAGCMLNDNKTDRMIQFSTRKGATPTVPFVKLYDKCLESKSKKSSVFFDRYFPEGVEPILRSEWTLKNKRHSKEGFPLYFINFDDDWAGESQSVDATEYFGKLTLKELLDIPDDIHTIFLEQIMNRHIKKALPMKQKKAGKTPLDSFISNMIEFCVSLGADLPQIVSAATSGMDKSNTYKYKKKITELYTEDMKEEDKNLHFDQLDLLDELGVL